MDDISCEDLLSKLCLVDTTNELSHCVLDVQDLSGIMTISHLLFTWCCKESGAGKPLITFETGVKGDQLESISFIERDC